MKPIHPSMLRDILVGALRVRDIDYFMPIDAPTDEALSDEFLIQCLVEQEDSRLRQALIGMFLVYPELGSMIPTIMERLNAKGRNELLAYYMAAVYLQQIWKILLKHYLVNFKELPDYYSSKLELPPPDFMFGRRGLYELSEWHKKRSPYPFNRMSEYKTAARLILQSLRGRRKK